MTQAPEPLTMEATITKPPGLVLSRLSAALLFSAGVVSLVAVALVTYSLAPCHSDSLDKLTLAVKPVHSRLYVRLPTSVVPHSYKVITLAYSFHFSTRIFWFKWKVGLSLFLVFCRYWHSQLYFII